MELSDLPWEIMTEILVRLPLNFLLRFGSTNRRWYSFVRDPRFLQLHNIRRPPCFTILTSPIPSSDDAPGIPAKAHTFCIRDESSMHTGSMLVPWDFSTMLGSSNGLVCIGSPPWQAAVLNPTTKEMLVLPNLSSPPSHACRNIGFGYHPPTNTYKVVQLIQLIGEAGLEITCCVFTVGVDEEWRVAGRIHCGAKAYSLSSACADGVLFWEIGSCHRDEELEDVILAFDLGREEFSSIKHPLDSGTGEMVELDGSLCFVHDKYQWDDDSEELMFLLDIWVLKDPRRGDWVRKYRLRIDSSLMLSTKPVHLDQKGRIFLSSCFRGLFIYDTAKETLKPHEGQQLEGFERWVPTGPAVFHSETSFALRKMGSSLSINAT